MKPGRKPYIDDTELLYEIILSKGKGMLTPKAEQMLMLIGNNFMWRKKGMYRCDADWNDCLQNGLLKLFNNWHKFNEKKYTKALPYMTEVFKRGIADSFNGLRYYNNHTGLQLNLVSLDAYFENNGGNKI